MSSWKIERVRESAEPEALGILFSEGNAAQTRTQVEQTVRRIEQSAVDTRGMILAREQTSERVGSSMGACWIEFQAGNVGHLYPPVVDHWRPDREQCERELYIAAEVAALEAGVTWVQCLLDPGARTAELLHKLGFSHVSTLIYQAALLPRKNAAPPILRIKSRPYEASQRTPLEDLIAATYEGSLDCPALNGKRTPAETLQSYECIGQAGTQHWQFIDHDGTTIGCLLLGVHAPDSPAARPLGELIYWGVIPSERGKGFGGEILELALAQAEALQLDKLVLAVDQANQPALRQYAQRGFFEWLRREAWGKSLGR